MNTALRSLACITLLILLAIPAGAQKPSRFKVIPGPKPGGGEVKITVAEGGQVQSERNEYTIFEGGVTIEYQDIKLTAWKVTYNQRTRDVTAEGNVIIDQGPTRVSANRAVYNLESKTGTFFTATGTMDPQMYFSGDQIEKVDADTYKLTNGVFTSCDLDRPAWSFHVGSATLNIDDYAHFRNLSFRARNIPIFWSPRLIWPTKRDRSQGFLIPRLRFSGDVGERLELGYFIPFGESADATITADLNTKGYLGGGVNVRYLPSQDVKIGDLAAYVVNDPEPTPEPGELAPDSRLQWRYNLRHSQENLPGGFRGVVDLENFSDIDFFRRYVDDTRLHTLSNIYSSAYLTKNRPRYSLNLLADRRELIFATTEQRFEQQPSVQFRMYPQRVANTPVYFSLESSASRLRTNSVGFIEDSSGAYYRTDFFPTLSLQLKTPAWFSLRPQLSLRETYYSASLEANPAPGSSRGMIDETLNRFYAQGQVELVGPSVSRIFDRSLGGFSRFKHVIEPRFRYVYTSNVGEQDRTIRFDTVDSPFLPIVRDTIEYSITQRLIGKEAGGGKNAREVLSFGLRQTASLSKPFPRGSSSSLSTANQKFTPLVATLRVNPYQSITVDASTTFGNVSHQIDQTSLSANLFGTGRLADKYMSLTWFATYRDATTNTANSSQWRINTGSTFLRERLRGDVQLNYDATARKFLEQRYILGTTGSCYGLAVGARRYLIYDPFEESKWSADFSVTLKNVGSIGSVK